MIELGGVRWSPKSNMAPDDDDNYVGLYLSKNQVKCI